MAKSPITQNKKSGFRGNDNLSKAGLKRNFTKEQLDEFIKSSRSYEYFIQNYCKIVSLDSEDGLILFKPYDYQKEVMQIIEKNKNIIMKYPRQSGKCGFFTTFIKIRSKKTGKIKEISLGDFYNLIDKS